MQVKLTDVEVSDLNNACIMIISKFARILRDHNGTVLRLRDKNVVKAVAQHAASSGSPELETLYMRLKVEIKNHLNKPTMRNGTFDDLVDKSRLKRKIQARRDARISNKET